MSVLVHTCDPLLRADLAAAVREAGHEAAELGSLLELETLLRDWHADVVILDLADPASEDAIQHLTHAAPGVGVLALGSRAGATSALEARRLGARGFLRKPFDVESLERALAAVAFSGRPSRDGLFVAEDPASKRFLVALQRAATNDMTILLRGESGVGKTRCAEWLHRSSVRSNAPFISVACSDLDGPDAAALLFGRNSKASDGRHRIGRFEAAHGGTLVLEDVDELPLEHQAPVLRVLQNACVSPLGTAAEVPIDVRVVATTHADLAAAVAAGRFRSDLLYRLDVIPLTVPPLRERPGDIETLADQFLTRFAASAGDRPARLDAAGAETLTDREFPGNVRELENLMRRAALLFPGASVDVGALDGPARRRTEAAQEPLHGFDLRTLEAETIARSLRSTRGNRTAAARALGISVRTLRNKIQRYGL